MDFKTDCSNLAPTQPAQAGRENEYRLAEGQVWEYLPSANLGCERRTIVVTSGGLRPVENGIVTCDDLEWFVANARLISPVARPVQEAAKAPVCSAFPLTLHGLCSGNILERHRYNGRRFLCDGHFLAFEARDFEAMNDDAKPTGLLRDPKIAERLPRPRLTHSAMWADECEDVR